MSYVKHKERVFLKKGHNVVKKRSDCNLRRVSSCNDVRAWSLSSDERRQHFLDSISSKSNKSFGKYIPPDVIVDILKKQNSSHLKKIIRLKRCSSEDSLKKRDSLGRRRSRINVALPADKSEQADIEELKYNLELNNLRSIVNELENKLTEMTCIKEENAVLKAQINTGIEKITNIQETGCIEVAKGVTSNSGSCEHLSQAIDLVSSKCNNMLANVEYLTSKNYELAKKLKKCSSNEKELRDRQLCVSLESVNNAILKNKVSSKNMKIQKLSSLNEAQRSQIENLLYQIKEMSIHFSWKEEMLVGRVMVFKNLAQSSYDKSIQYINKLSLSQAVIKEMEILGDHFRKVNAALKENTDFYKNRLSSVCNKALQMGSKIEFLLREIAKRDKKIKELSQFPGRSSMAIRLAQLDEILNSDFLFKTNSTAVVETYGRLKRILKDLKTEAWDNYGLEHPLTFYDGSSQASIDYSVACVQFNPYMSDNFTQTMFPDEYIVQYIMYIIIINLCNELVGKLRRSLKNVYSRNKVLEMKVTVLQDTLNCKVDDINNLKNENSYLHTTVNSLNNLIAEEHSNVALVIKNNDCELAASQSLNNLLTESFSATLEQFYGYCNFLESVIMSNCQKSQEFFECFERELEAQRLQHCCEMAEIKEKYSLLQQALSNEIKVGGLLSCEIDCLATDLLERDKALNEIAEIWHYAKIKTDNDQMILPKNICLDNWSQIDIDFSESEVMIDTESFAVNPQSSDKIVQAHFNDCTCKKKKFFVKSRYFIDNVLQKKMSQVYVKVKRIRIRIINLKNKLEMSVETLNKMRESNTWLTEVNRNITSDNINLKNKNRNLMDVISHLRCIIRNESLKNEQLQENQMKLMNDFHRIQSDLMRLNHPKSNMVLTEKSVNTDLVMFDFKQSLDSKDNCISQMKERIEKLLDLLKEIEEEKKNKENMLISISCQCDVHQDVEDKYQKLVSDIKNNYDSVIERLKRDHSEEKERKEKYFRNNLSLLKDTYERDIKRIKASNSDSLRKIQSFHEEEIRTIKLYHEENKTITEQPDSNFIHEKHSRELEQLRLNYESNMKEKSELFIKEKEYLQEEMKKYMAEKENQVEEISKRMEEGIKNMKKKCKQHMKKLQRENCFALEQLKKQCGNGKAEEALSMNISNDMYSALHEEYSVTESLEGHCLKDNSDIFVEARNDTSGIEEDLSDCGLVDERRFLMRRIQLLEEQLAEKQKESSENACDSEKRVWVERERCRELSRLLDKELERNEKLRSKMRDEKSRADHLLMVNHALLDKIRNLDSMNHEKDVDTYRLLNKDQYSHSDYQDLFGNFDSSHNSEFINNCASNHLQYL